MKRVVQVVALSGLMTLVAGWLAAAPAGAAAPQVTHTKVNVTLTGIDVCGFTVDSVVQGTDTFKVFFDRFGNVSIQDVSHVVSTLTNEANGKVVHVEPQAGMRSSPTRWSTGTAPSPLTDTLTGIPLRIYTSHSNTLVKDVGFISMRDHVRCPGERPQRAGDRAWAAPVRRRRDGNVRRDRVRDRVVRRIFVRAAVALTLASKPHTHAATLRDRAGCLGCRGRDLPRDANQLINLGCVPVPRPP